MKASASASSLLLVILMTVSLAMLLSACSRPKVSSDLCGTYVANYKVASEKLILDKDGKFTQEVTIKATSKVDVAKGKWRYDPKDGHIRFEDTYMSVLDGFGEFNPNYAHPKPGVYTTEVDKLFGTIRIGVYVNEQNVVYKKVK